MKRSSTFFEKIWLLPNKWCVRKFIWTWVGLQKSRKAGSMVLRETNILSVTSLLFSVEDKKTLEVPQDLFQFSSMVFQ